MDLAPKLLFKTVQLDGHLLTHKIDAFQGINAFRLFIFSTLFHLLTFALVEHNFFFQSFLFKLEFIHQF